MPSFSAQPWSILLFAQEESAIDALIGDLGDDDWDVREKAVEGLVKIGKEALPRVEIASRSDDPEVAARAKRVIEWNKFNSIEEGKIINGLQARLQSDKVQYYSGDPILLTLIVVNVSEISQTITPIRGLDRKIEVPAESQSSDFSTSHGRLVVKCVSKMHEGGSFGGRWQEKDPDKTPVKLKSGEKCVKHVAIVPSQETRVEGGDGDRYIVPIVAGSYDIHWTYYAKKLLPDMPEDLVSNTLKIEVTGE